MAHTQLEALGSFETPPKMSARKLPMRDSVVACLFLSFYVGTYMAAGFVGVTAIEWAWVKLIG
jgi:hypothetical protein